MAYFGLLFTTNINGSTAHRLFCAVLVCLASSEALPLRGHPFLFLFFAQWHHFLVLFLFFLFLAPHGASPCSQLSATAAFSIPPLSHCSIHWILFVICCQICAYAYSCVWLVQGWEDVDGAALQLCAACNLPWLDTSFQLAPDAEMDSGISWAFMKHI